MSSVAGRIFLVYFGVLWISWQFSPGSATDLDKLSSIYTKLVERLKESKTGHSEVQMIQLDQGFSLCRKKLKEDLESSSRTKEDIIMSVKLCIATKILHFFHLYNHGSGLSEGELNILVEIKPDLDKFVVNFSEKNPDKQLSTEFSIQVDSSSPDSTKMSSSSTSIDENMFDNFFITEITKIQSINENKEDIATFTEITNIQNINENKEDIAPPWLSSLSVISPPMFGESLLSKLLSGIFGVLILMLIVATIIGCRYLTKSRQLQRQNEDLVPSDVSDKSEDEMRDMEIDTKTSIPVPPALPSAYRYHRYPPLPHQLQPPYQHHQPTLRQPQNSNYQLRQPI